MVHPARYVVARLRQRRQLGNNRPSADTNLAQPLFALAVGHRRVERIQARRPRMLENDGGLGPCDLSGLIRDAVRKPELNGAEREPTTQR